MFTVKTPLGPLTVELDRDAVVATMFDDQARATRSRHPVAVALEEYFDGDVTALDEVSISLPGDGFRARAQRALRKIPAGRTISYAELARHAGSPNATRAAGSACATNPIGVIVPCHRVLRAGGAIGGYAGGLDRKRWLLEHERAHLHL
jgi:methylated-DNA-[protein]-cysteine S-methyltransferase